MTRSPSTPSPSTSLEDVDPVSPLSPISPWPPLPLPLQTSSHPDPRLTHLPNATDVYSSIAILGTYALFALYLVWGLSPRESWWVGWLPDRRWAIIVPCWLMVLVLSTYFAYAALVVYRTPAFDSVECITDPYANIPPRGEKTEPYYWKYAGRDAMNEAVDLPVDLVGRVLYPSAGDGVPT